MAVALFYTYKPLFAGMDTMWEDYNKALIFIGVSLSFSTMQDYQRTQNKLSKIIYENPKYSRIFIIYMLILTLFLFCSGFFIIYLSNDENLRELSYGIIVLGIGMIGMIKMGTEMAVYHGTKKPKEIPGE